MFTLQKVYEDGKAAKANGQATATPPSPDDVYMFSYTSGTTGPPKGVKLTHRMVLGCAFAVNARLASAGPICDEDTFISYLPAAHSFE